MLVTSPSLSAESVSAHQVVRLYHKRADAENLFDQITNQWGFSGFCSSKAVVTEMAAQLLLLLTYTFCLLFAQKASVLTQAVTSRNQLLLLLVKLVKSEHQKNLKLAISGKWWAAISQACKRLQVWLAQNAPQGDAQQTLERNLCWNNNPYSPDHWLAQHSP